MKYALFLFLLTLYSCAGMKNPDRPIPDECESGYFVTSRDGLKIFVYELVPPDGFNRTIYIISGITGINHTSEKDIIELLCNNENRVVVIHPRGTGYSEGTRGDITDFSDYITDYVRIISGDSLNAGKSKKVILYGHSMSCAIAIKVANQLHKKDGLILVNPPYRLRSARGMSPKFSDYIKYIGYFLFAPHKPVVNMAGDPSALTNEEDRTESELRNNDPLLIKYFSIHCMLESKKLIETIVENARHADYPLLLLYGENDLIVDKSGCDEIYFSWKSQEKNYTMISGGSHGKSTVIKGSDVLLKWMKDV